MRFQSGHAEVLAEGFGQSANFSILASGKAFKGLIDGIYSRKVEAAVRELATNAFDSHKAAGSIAPFDIHLPTTLRPQFYIRDYGTGITHQYMMERYTVMFDSTKDGAHEEDQKTITADEQVGMLGLGRMSFFAYTDACTITSWTDGMVRHYTVFMGPDGVPRVAFAGEAPSDEPSGVKVEFPVKTKDFAEFTKAATRVFKGFPVMPSGLPVAVREAISKEPLQIGSFWKAFEKDYLPDSGFYARQGCVLYPIDLTVIDDHALEEEDQKWDYHSQQWITVTKPVLSEKFARFKDMKMTVIIDFPIGALEFDLSRERLAYNDRSTRALHERWAEFTADLDTTLADQFEPLETGWERMQLAGQPQFKDMGLLVQQSSYMADANATWNSLFTGLPPTRSDRRIGLPFFSVIKNTGHDDPQVIYAQDFFGAPSKTLGEDAAKTILIYRDDAKAQGVNRRVHAYLKSIDAKYAFIFDTGGLTPDFYKELGHPPIVRVSSLPALPRRTWNGGAGNGGPPPFERIKVISDNGQTYDGATSEEQYEDHQFFFINKGMAYNPDPEKYPNLTATQMMEMHACLHYFTGRSISLINIKKNEFDKLDRWADYPLAYGCLEGIMDSVGMKDLRDLVNLINYERFSGTKYDTACRDYRAAFKGKATGPLADMYRFEQRYNRIPVKRRYLLNSFIDGSAMKPFRDEIIDRAKAIGLEVLPPMEAASRYHSRFYPYPLLPKKWEEMVRLINKNGKLHRDERRFIYTAIKEKIGC